MQQEAEGLNPLNVDTCKQVTIMVEWLIELERCCLKTELNKIIVVYKKDALKETQNFLS